MAQLTRVSEKDKFPQWVDENNKTKNTISAMSRSDFQRVARSGMNDDRLVGEMEYLEKCASENRPYFYSSAWSDRAKGRIREYASVCECDIEEIDLNSLEVKAYTQHLTKTAHVEDESSVPFEVMDAFKLDEKAAAADHLAQKENWQQVKNPVRASDMTEEDRMTSRTIKSHAGSGVERHDATPHLKVRPGQNSVAAPDAIGDEIRSTAEDNGVRLRREAKERAETRKHARSEWERDAVAHAEKLGQGAMATPKVSKHTNTYTYHSGIKDRAGVMPGVFQKEIIDLPDLTAGEKLKQKNASRRSGIQRKADKSRDWDSIEHTRQSEFSISDTFYEELKKLSK